jgi:hypothetical protein
MQMHVGMPGQEIVDALGLVRREVVGDEVNLFAARLVRDDVAEKGHELGAGAAVLPKTCRPASSSARRTNP